MNRLYEEARQLNYIQMLTMFVWDNSNKVYSKRKQKGTIGRLVNIHPNAGDRYYLRILVSLVKGPTCYDDLYTVGDTKHDTFQAACLARGLLDGDKEWQDAMIEASQFSSPRCLRRLFVLILIFCQVSDRQKLWNNTWQCMSEDVLPHQRRLLQFPELELTPHELQQYTLIEIEGLQFDTAEESRIHKELFPVASSAIAALLLPGGRTAHSRFKIPLKLHEDTFCEVKKGTTLANFLSQADLIIWDEVPMAHRHAVEAFGSKTVLLGGDFRQILPVIPQGTRQDTVNAAVNQSHLWNQSW